MSKFHKKINTDNKKIYANTIIFKNGKASLTYFVDAPDFVSANMLAIQRYIRDYCDGNENILLKQTEIKKVICQPTRSKKRPISKTIKSYI